MKWSFTWEETCSPSTVRSTPPEGLLRRLAVLSVLLLLAACATGAGGKNADQTPPPITADATLKNADQQLEQRNYSGAARLYHDILKSEPANAGARLGLGEIALSLGKLDEARISFAALTEDVIYRPKALQGLGITLLRRGDAPGAQAALEQAVATDAGLWRAWNALGQAYDLQRSWDASRHAYERALTHAPGSGISAVIHNNKGMSLLAQSQYADALASFERAQAADPALTIVETNRKLALAMQQRYPEATFVTKPEEKAKALNNAGYVALMRGDYDRAEQLFVQAMDANPSFYQAAADNLQIVQQMKSAQR